MNLLDILTNSPHYFYRKCVGVTNENFYLRVKQFDFYFPLFQTLGRVAKWLGRRT